MPQAPATLENVPVVMPKYYCRGNTHENFTFFWLIPLVVKLKEDSFQGFDALRTNRFDGVLPYTQWS